MDELSSQTATLRAQIAALTAERDALLDIVGKFTRHHGAAHQGDGLILRRINALPEIASDSRERLQVLLRARAALKSEPDASGEG